MKHFLIPESKGIMVTQKYSKVLLVDDDNINNFINVRLIKRVGVSDNVVITNNGQEAIDYLQKINEEKPDLILLDINMPVMDGFEFLKEFEQSKTADYNPLIIVLTTSSNLSDLEKVKGSSLAAGYINKPLTEENLVGFIKRMNEN
ncbi:MAG: response regulator [Cytophagaceae bacterium]